MGERAREVKVKTPETDQLGGACDWKLLVDLNQKFSFPPKVVVTNLKPDPVLWSSTLHTLYIIEITVPWEDAVEEAYLTLKYEDP